MPSIVVPVGQARPVDASSYFTEPDGEALVYGATSSNLAAVTASAAGSIVMVKVVATGAAAVTVTARDPGGLGASQDFVVMALKRLTTNTDDLAPAWSPDGTKIAVSSGRDGDGSEIYVMDADGGNRTRLTYTKRDWGPAWSPDGTKVAFASFLHRNGYGDYDIYVMDADGGNRTRLTNDTANDWNPAWSPDGTKIAFASDRDDDDGYVFNIYVIWIK